MIAFFEIIILVILIFLLSRRREANFSIGIIIFLYSFLAAIRPLTSADTLTYKFYYDYSANIQSYRYSFGRNYFMWVEDWYINFCSFFSKLNVDYSLYLFIVAILILVISLYSLNRIFKILFNKGNHLVIVTIFIHYIFNYGFLYSYVVIRGGLSLAFSLLTFSFFLEKKWMKTVCFFSISYAFHNYSIIMLLIMSVFLLNWRMVNKRLVYFIFIILIILNLFRFDILFTDLIISTIGFLKDGTNIFQFGHYLMDAENMFNLKLGALFPLLESLFLSYLYKDNFNDINIRRIFVVLILGSLINVLINDNATLRITNYFYILQTILFAKYIQKNVKNESTKLRISCLKYPQILIVMVLIPLFNIIYILRYCSVI